MDVYFKATIAEVIIPNEVEYFDYFGGFAKLTDPKNESKDPSWYSQ